jgi:hypothetical protein
LAALSVRIEPSQTGMSLLRTTRSFAWISAAFQNARIAGRLLRIELEDAAVDLIEHKQVACTSEVSACGPVNSTSSPAAAMPTVVEVVPMENCRTTVSAAAAAPANEATHPIMTVQSKHFWQNMFASILNNQLNC